MGTAATFDDSELMDGLRGVIELSFVRMKLGLVEEDIGLRSLGREELPKLVGIVKLVSYSLGKYIYSGKPEKVVQEKASQLPSGLQWVEAGRS